MRPRSAARLAAVAVALLAPGALAGPTAVEVQPVPAAAQGAEAEFPTYDAAGRPAGAAPWWVTDAGGNCCEVYVDTTADGRVVEYGGEEPWVSADGGRTWKTAAPTLPVLVGEGAITSAPNGDVLGIVWDTVQQRLTAHKHEAATGKWLSEEVAVRGEFYDRPYIAVAPGPFVVDGRTVPYVSVVNLNTYEPEWSFVSTDGLTYLPASWTLDEDAAPPVVSWLPTQRAPGSDWTQGHPGSEITSLARGALVRPDRSRSAYLRALTSARCDSYVMLPPEPAWRCFELPQGELPPGPLVSDAAGHLHTATGDDGRVRVASSRDGGRTWSAVALPAPVVGEVIDVVVRASGARRRLAVATHVRVPDKRSAFYVSVLDTSAPRPRFLRTYQLGASDSVLSTSVGEAAETDNPRFDFPSVAFLPDGRLVAAFTDRRHSPPRMAISRKPV